MSAETDRIGRTVAGKFVVEALLGGGAMGEVFRARHVELGTHVALKIMRPDVASEPTFRERFAREARTASRLDHPNIVRVLDYGEDDGIVYLAMELIEGRTLLELLRQEHPLPDVRVADILAQTLAAAGAAHELGLVHRDMKPENIMVRVTRDDDGHEREHVKVCDFGIAKVNDPRLLQSISGETLRSPSERPPALDAGALELGLTSGGSIVGTPEYMSPSRCAAGLDARAISTPSASCSTRCSRARCPSTATRRGRREARDGPADPRPSSRGGCTPSFERICLAPWRSGAGPFASAREMRAQVRTVLRTSGRAATEPSGTRARRRASRACRPSRPRGPSCCPASARPATAKAARWPRRGPRLRPARRGRSGWSAPPRSRSGRRWSSPSPAIAAATRATTRRPTRRRPSWSSRRSAAPKRVPSRRCRSRRPRHPPAARARPTRSTATPGTTWRTPTPSSPRRTPRPRGSARPHGRATPRSSCRPRRPPTSRPARSTRRTREVNVRSVDARGVKEVAVRAKLAVLRDALAQCYRSSLRVAGGAVAGQPTLSLSVDERGKVMSAVLLGAEALPGLQRCVPAAMAGQSLGLESVEGPGATAEVHLELVPE